MTNNLLLLLRKREIASERERTIERGWLYGKRVERGLMYTVQSAEAAMFEVFVFVCSFRGVVLERTPAPGGGERTGGWQGWVGVCWRV